MSANIRIINRLDGEIKPYQLTLIPLDDPNAPDIVLPYNPESFDHTVTPSWSDDELAGAEQNSASWKGNGPGQFRFRIRLTPGATGVVQSDGRVSRDYAAESAVETVLTALRNLSTRPTDRTQEPTRFDVIAGEFFFVGHITACKMRRTQTNERGHAIEAEIDLTFEENVRR